jgi:hypothetical protein
MRTIEHLCDLSTLGVELDDDTARAENSPRTKHRRKRVSCPRVLYEIIEFSLSLCQPLAKLEEENDDTKGFVCPHLHLLHLATSDGICRVPSIHYQNTTHSINAIEVIQDNTCIGIVPDLRIVSRGSTCAQSSHPISSCLIHQIQENVTTTSSLRRMIFCSNFF